MTYITHITLTTGHVTRQQRPDMPDAAVAAAQQWLSAALVHDGKQRVQLPKSVADPHYSGVALSTPGGVIVTIYGHHAGMGVDIPIISFGMARRSRNAQKLWGQLCAAAKTAPTEPPPAPWVAVIVYVSLAAFRDAAAWLGGFETALGWAHYEGID